MKLQAMDPAVILDMIKDVPDLITPAAKAKAEYFSQLKCVSCGSTVTSEVERRDLERAGETGEIVPYGKARCTACGCLFEPTTRIIVERGNIAKAIEPTGPIIPPDAMQ